MSVQLTGSLRERGDTPLGDRCPLDRAISVVGNRTALLLLREIAYGASRFDSLARRVGVTDAVASQRLKELVAAGVLAKVPYQEPGQRTRHEYVLTESGEELAPVLVALLTWGRKHVAGPGRWSVDVTHADCDEDVRTELRCAAGHVVPLEEITVDGHRTH